MQSKRITAFDGLRCIACLLVLASHVGVLRQGGFANRIFFVLCGFLCVRYNSEEQFFSLKEIVYYYCKKAIRILPSFYLILFSVHLFTGMFTKRELFENMLFLKSYSVWWFLQQTMFFYLFVPFIHIVIYLTRKVLQQFNINNLPVHCVIIAIEVFLLGGFFSLNPPFSLFGNGMYIEFQLGMFLFGISCRYIFELLNQLSYIYIYKFKNNYYCT